MRRLLAIRRREIVPRLAGAAFGKADAADNGLLTAQWRMGDGATFRLRANLSAREIAVPSTETAGTRLWGGETGPVLPPWSVFWDLEGR